MQLGLLAPGAPIASSPPAWLCFPACVFDLRTLPGAARRLPSYTTSPAVVRDREHAAHTATHRACPSRETCLCTTLASPPPPPLVLPLPCRNHHTPLPHPEGGGEGGSAAPDEDSHASSPSSGERDTRRTATRGSLSRSPSPTGPGCRRRPWLVPPPPTPIALPSQALKRHGTSRTDTPHDSTTHHVFWKKLFAFCSGCQLTQHIHTAKDYSNIPHVQCPHHAKYCLQPAAHVLD
ncbi:hypothetical protein ACJQWK_11608 [Exserohilum turcicum]